MGQKPESAEHLIERVKHALNLLGAAETIGDYGHGAYIAVYHKLGHAEVRSATTPNGEDAWKIELYTEVGFDPWYTEYAPRLGYHH